MRVKALRTLGSSLVTELSKAGMKIPLALENEEFDCSEPAAKLLIENKLVDVVVAGKIAPKEAAPAAKDEVKK